MGADSGLKFTSFKVLSIDYIMYFPNPTVREIHFKILFRDSDDSNDFKYRMFI